MLKLVQLGPTGTTGMLLLLLNSDLRHDLQFDCNCRTFLDRDARLLIELDAYQIYNLDLSMNCGFS